MSQRAFGAEIDVTQGNVSHYEQGQEIPPAVARRVIAAAERHGLQLTFDDIYGLPAPLEVTPQRHSKPRPLPESGEGANPGCPTAEQASTAAQPAIAAQEPAGAKRTAGELNQGA